MKWKDKIINHFVNELRGDSKWSSIVEKISSDSSIGVHLAIFNEPFLSLIINGKKKIESRFSMNKITPFMKVRKGDIVILKESGGLVTGAFIAGDVKYINNLDKIILKKIENDYGELICSNYDKNFWENRTKARYVSLIEVKNVKRLKPFKSEKNDRSGWSILKDRISITATLFNDYH
jgi:hypothetical protein